jgi:hypothetical protein
VQNCKVCSYEDEIERELSLISRYDEVVFNVNSKTTFLNSVWGREQKYLQNAELKHY